MTHDLITVFYYLIFVLFKTFYFFRFSFTFILINNFTILLYYYILKLFDRKLLVNNSIKGKSSNI